MTEQQQLSNAYSGLKDMHVALQRRYNALLKECNELREECKKYGRLYWEAKDELNNLIRGRECPQEEKL